MLNGDDYYLYRRSKLLNDANAALRWLIARGRGVHIRGHFEYRRAR